MLTTNSVKKASSFVSLTFTALSLLIRQQIHEAAQATNAIITVEDHFAEGGIGEAVRTALGPIAAAVYSLSVRKMPKSGKPEELLDYEEISANAIIKQAKEII